MNILTPGPIQREWLNSLRNNPERQHKGSLGFKGENGLTYCCCLGELGLIAGKCKLDPITNHVQTIGGSEGVLIDVYKELGLFTSTGMPCESLKALSILNDNEMTWPQIADHVERNFGVYFNKSY